MSIIIFLGVKTFNKIILFLKIKLKLIAKLKWASAIILMDYEIAAFISGKRIELERVENIPYFIENQKANTLHLPEKRNGNSFSVKIKEAKRGPSKRSIFVFLYSK